MYVHMLHSSNLHCLSMVQLSMLLYVHTISGSFKEDEVKNETEIQMYEEVLKWAGLNGKFELINFNTCTFLAITRLGIGHLNLNDQVCLWNFNNIQVRLRWTQVMYGIEVRLLWTQVMYGIQVRLLWTQVMYGWT